eukprot:TRINITY_DN45314_c0_g1_i1.p1 TRINITY_DN45314_c0_g1~~TRINITY_DN45314_c0_g1_i1.p1  ORF type:complete len:183 (+),score=23.25 TRINITY_DN45314_c0_g1_i1:50-550(+)
MAARSLRTSSSAPSLQGDASPAGRGVGSRNSSGGFGAGGFKPVPALAGPNTTGYSSSAAPFVGSVDTNRRMRTPPALNELSRPASGAGAGSLGGNSPAVGNVGGGRESGRHGGGGYNVQRNAGTGSGSRPSTAGSQTGPKGGSQWKAMAWPDRFGEPVPLPPAAEI